MPRRVERNRIGPREVSAHGDHDREQQRAEQHQQQRRADDVERALEREVDALEHRRPQLEQRHRLAGHELGAVDQDLHRRRREPHAHAAPVALVDELDRVDLGEVGIGDDHLVDRARDASTRSRSASEPSERRPLAGSALRREEPDDLDRVVRRVAERVGDVADVLAACPPAPPGAGSRRRAATAPVSHS